MAVPKLLKSTPFLASSGAVGVGGTSVIIWQTTGKGSSDTNDTVTESSTLPPPSSLSISHTAPKNITSPQKIWLFQDTFEEKDFSDSSITWDSFSVQTKDEEVSSSIRADNNIFELYSTRCYKTLFGEESSIGRHDSVWLIGSSGVEESFSDEEILAKEPNSENTGALTGCSMMNLSYNNGNFLFRSEIVTKTDNLGMALWTGIKGFIPKGDGVFGVNLIHYLVFLEKKNSGWTPSGGYSWGGKDHILKVKSLTIKSPDESSINQTFDQITDSSSGDKNYFGVWESSADSSGSEILGFEKAEYVSKDQSSPPSPFVFDSSSKIKGYVSGADIFYKRNDQGGKRGTWKKHEEESKYSDIVASIEKWYEKLLKDKKGSWKSMSDYCKGKEDLPDDEKSQSLCYKQKNQ